MLTRIRFNAHFDANRLGRRSRPSWNTLTTRSADFYNGVMSTDGFLSTPDHARTLSVRPGPQSAPAPRELNKWRQAMQDPTHSSRYAQRWERLVEEGMDIHGEARAIDAMAQRGSRILDAGCGTGRLAGYLAAAGHQVTGIDLDPHLIEVAQHSFPAAHFQVADLADFTLTDDDAQSVTFDLIVSAGNVQTFLADWERVPALRNVVAHLTPDGRFVTGFQLARGYSDTEFSADAQAAGLQIIQRFATWQFDPYDPAGEFLLAVLQRSA